MNGTGESDCRLNFTAPQWHEPLSCICPPGDSESVVTRTTIAQAAGSGAVKWWLGASPSIALLFLRTGLYERRRIHFVF